MANSAGYTQPIYEAVVASLTLENLLRAEDDQQRERVLATALETVASANRVVDMFSGQVDLSTSESSWPIPSVQLALSILITVTRQAAADAQRNQIAIVSDNYRMHLTKALSDLTASANRLEEIAEAWTMASDSSLVAEIKQLLSVLRKTDDKVIPHWRNVLADVSD